MVHDVGYVSRFQQIRFRLIGGYDWNLLLTTSLSTFHESQYFMTCHTSLEQIDCNEGEFSNFNRNTRRHVFYIVMSLLKETSVLSWISITLCPYKEGQKCWSEFVNKLNEASSSNAKRNFKCSYCNCIITIVSQRKYIYIYVIKYIRVIQKERIKIQNILI